jgi:hypothetical protein
VPSKLMGGGGRKTHPAPQAKKKQAPRTHFMNFPTQISPRAPKKGMRAPAACPPRGGPCPNPRPPRHRAPQAHGGGGRIRLRAPLANKIQAPRTLVLILPSNRSPGAQKQGLRAPDRAGRPVAVWLRDLLNSSDASSVGCMAARYGGAEDAVITLIRSERLFMGRLYVIYGDYYRDL